MRLFRRRDGAAEAAGDFVLGPLQASEAMFTSWPAPKLATLPLGGALEGRSDDELRAAGITLIGAYVAVVSEPRSYKRRELMTSALSTIGRRKLAWTLEEASEVVRQATRVGPNYWQSPIKGFVTAVVERAGGCVDPSTVAAYQKLLTDSLSPSDAAKVVNRLRPFTPAVAGDVDPRIASDGDGWGQGVRELLAQVDPPAGIDELLSHLAASSLRPSKRWLAQTETLVAAAPAAPGLLRAMAERVLEVDLQPGRGEWAAAVMFTGANAELVRGAAFALAVADPASASLLGEIAAHAGTTPGGSGVARDEKVANGCVAALGLVGTDDAVAALGRVQQRVRNRNVRKQIDRSLRTLAEAAGIGVDEIVERTVPAHGLDHLGCREHDLGGDVVRLQVDGDRVRLLAAKAKGGWTATLPKRLRDDHGPALSSLRAAATEATKTLRSERRRVESLLATDRSWPLADWARLYRDHPLTGAWAARLLWAIADGAGGWTSTRLDDGSFLDSTGETVEVDDHTVVRLWHPIAAPPDEVRTWRALLAQAEAEVRQPFKQAWREVYLLTPAEEQTGTYSNRFAAHILRYPQAFALMKGRDWAASALGYWDGGYDGTATKVFPGGRWRASFHYDLVERGEEDGYATPMLCSTDQVRFDELAGGTWETMPLAAVPPLVFSEAIRDVDLFVGVASIAADPSWADRGEDRHLAYWHTTSFGELTESAETRRLALAQLIPRTKIADRVSLDGRFLRVRGRLRTYKIHVGSGNILMEPNDQYLCIVASGSATRDRIFLPFEEDGGRLSLIISKAFMLADDHKITDGTILHQINNTRDQRP